jgi:uncharacterized membrane protein
MESIRDYLGLAGYAIEAAGVLVILIGLAWSTGRFLVRLQAIGGLPAYGELRRNVGRSIILGLEFLIAGDIIRTVTVSQTLEGVAILVVIVLIRVLLTIALELETEGHWPWQRAGGEKL